LNRVHSAVPDGRNDTVIIVPVVRPEQVGPDTGDGLNFTVAAVQLGLDLIGTQLGKIGMVVRMIHDLVPGFVQCLYRFGEFIHPFTNHEKGGFHVIFSQNINQLLCILVPPG